jgi:aryl-alcohol dehydrogenase-like predicted oxidoreductase
VLFDAADTYGNGLSEELIAKAFPNQRDEIVIATKVRYDFVHYGEARGRGQREIPQDFFARNLSATAGLNDLLTSARARSLSARRSVFSRTSSNSIGVNS